MIRFALFLGLGTGVALGATGNQIFSQQDQAASQTAPTSCQQFTQSSNASTVGNSLNLYDVDGFRVSVCGPSGDGIQATGTLQAYLCDERANEVMRNPSLDLTVSAAAHCQVFPDQETIAPFDRVMYIANGLKLTDGGVFMTQTDGGLDAGAFTVRMRGWKAASR